MLKQGWRKQRRIFNSLLSPAASKKFYPYQDYESKQYIYDILTSPDQFYEHAERFATSILTSTVYGCVKSSRVCINVLIIFTESAQIISLIHLQWGLS